MSDLRGRGSHAQHARRAIVEDSASQLAQKIQQPVSDVESLRSAASHPALTEEQAFTLLERRDLPSAVVDDLAKNGRVMKYRKLRLAVVHHPRTPKHVSLPIIRRLYTFELMKVATAPGIAADVKIAAEEALLGRFGTISAGEKLTLGKLASARVAAGLLQDPDKRVVNAALDNPFLTETWIIKAVVKQNPSEILALHVAKHRKWSVRKDVRAALLRNEFTTLAHAIEFAQSFSLESLNEILYQSALPEKIKTYLLNMAGARTKKQRGH
jgi:hypothetical protein